MNDELRKKIEALAPVHNKSQIARELKVNINTVNWYCYKYKIVTFRPKATRVRYDDDTKKELIKKIEALAYTHNKAMISETLKLPIESVRRLCREAGIEPLKERAFTIKQRQKIAAEKEKHSKEYQDRMEAIRKACYFHAVKKGFRHEADDFAGWAVAKILGGKAKFNIRFLYADYMRETQGYIVRANKGNEIQNAKLAHNYSKNRISGTEPVMGDSEKEGDGFMDIATPPPQDEIEINIADTIRFKNKFVRAYLILIHKYGLTGKEVGEVFGISDSLISVEIKDEIALQRKRKELGLA